MPLKLSSVQAKAAFLVSVTVALALVSWLYPLHYGSVGTIDFVQYWRSWHLLWLDKNPYDLNLAKSFESSLANVPQHLLMSWNPPWTFTLVSPVLFMSFGSFSVVALVSVIRAIGNVVAVAPVFFARHRGDYGTRGAWDS